MSSSAAIRVYAKRRTSAESSEIRGPQADAEPVALARNYKLIYNFNVGKRKPEPAEPVASADLLSRFSGPAQTIAASLPKELADAIRSQVGKRGFSRFVGRALARELIDQNRAAYVGGMESIHGPVDPELVARLEEVLSR